MIKKCIDNCEISFVLNNLRIEDMEELKALHGEDWLNITFNELKDRKVLVMYGKNEIGNVIPIAIGGFEAHIKNPSIAIVWLLSSVFIDINKTLFWKDIKFQIFQASMKYKIMYNFIYKSNLRAKNWLQKLGFLFDNPKPKNIKVAENFEFFYKVKRGE